jgi:hypothetical protein
MDLLVNIFVYEQLKGYAVVVDRSKGRREPLQIVTLIGCKMAQDILYYVKAK